MSCNLYDASIAIQMYIYIYIYRVKYKIQIEIWDNVHVLNKLTNNIYCKANKTEIRDLPGNYIYLTA